MRELTTEEIEILSGRAGVKKIAVENFLITVTNNPSMVAAIANMKYDASLYRWNEETQLAILDGILLAWE